MTDIHQLWEYLMAAVIAGMLLGAVGFAAFVEYRHRQFIKEHKAKEKRLEHLRPCDCPGSTENGEEAIREIRVGDLIRWGSASKNPFGSLWAVRAFRVDDNFNLHHEEATAILILESPRHRRCQTCGLSPVERQDPAKTPMWEKVREASGHQSSENGGAE